MSGTTDAGPMVAVRRFVDGFNDDDVDEMQAACLAETSIIDDFPPHEWSGRAAATRWYRDMAGMATGHGMSDWSVLLEEPQGVAVSGAHAYVVVPVVVQWLQGGAQVRRTGFFTAGLREAEDGWRISAFAWTWT